MKTTGREFFYSVSGLMVPKYIVSDQFSDSLDQFVESVPKVTDALERFITYELDTEYFVHEMENLYMALCSIHAHWLEVEAAKILRLTEVNEGELCRMLVMPFLTNVRTLAIDIQMAQNRGADVIYRKRSEMERYKDVVSSMGVVTALLNDLDFKKALDIVKSINELQDSDYIMPLISHIASKNKEQAMGLVKEINYVYQQKIDEINHTAKTNIRKKVLIVDDMPEILTVVSYMLKEHYQVFPFQDGGDALRAVDSSQQLDAFLLDIDMPRMDGFTLAEKIRQRAKYRSTPILFLTANSTRDNLISSVRYNPKSFIVKPVNRDIIIARLSSCLGGLRR